MIPSCQALPFDPACRACPRLVGHRECVGERFPDYHAAPVPAFGPADAALVIVGLAPGMHGANATGRPFTGDHAGIMLYRTLFELGLSNAPCSRAPGDGLELHGCRITNAVKCLPPDNRPTTAEIRTCNGFLAAEIAQHPPRVIVALGRIAHDAVLRALGLRLASHRFAHGQAHDVAPSLTLFDSYHCSRYNTQTGRLTEAMFREVIAQAAALSQEQVPRGT